MILLSAVHHQEVILKSPDVVKNVRYLMMRVLVYISNNGLVNKCIPFLRQQRDLDQQLRQQQEEEFLLSLRADQEKVGVFGGVVTSIIGVIL